VAAIWSDLVHSSLTLQLENQPACQGLTSEVGPRIFVIGQLNLPMPPARHGLIVAVEQGCVPAGSPPPPTLLTPPPDSPLV
jgi:hypothetical protein